jgi:hypothetical protein
MASNTAHSRKDLSGRRATATVTATEAAVVDSNPEAMAAVLVAAADSATETAETRATAAPHSAQPATRASRKRLNHSLFDNENN